MKIGIKLAIGAVLVGCGVAFAVGLLERTLEQKSDPA